MSDPLVPSCGAWFGAATPSLDGTFDHTRGLAEYERLVGVSPSILHFYERGGEPFPTAEHVALADRAGDDPRILFFSWKPAPDLTWRAVAEGGADDAIDAVAARMGSYPHRFFLAIHHEPENDVDPRPGSGMTVADYVAMYRHVVERLRGAGVDRAVFVMTYMGFERWAPIVDDLYPGDDVVDWIGYDPYGFAHVRSPADLLDSADDSNGWQGFYSWATAKAPGTPIMLAEWGFPIVQHPAAPAILGDLVGALRSDYPMIKALVYWHARGTRIDARLDQGTEAGREFLQAFRSLAADPYFAMTAVPSEGH